MVLWDLDLISILLFFFWNLRMRFSPSFEQFPQQHSNIRLCVKRNKMVFLSQNYDFLELKLFMNKHVNDIGSGASSLFIYMCK
jgi:hypothetical protein